MTCEPNTNPAAAGGLRLDTERRNLLPVALTCTEALVNTDLPELAADLTGEPATAAGQRQIGSGYRWRHVASLPDRHAGNRVPCATGRRHE